MKFDHEFKPWLAASTDETRIHLAQVMLDVESRRLVATNGHIIVAVPCDPSSADKTGLISVDSLKWAVDHCGFNRKPELDCADPTLAIVRPSGVMFPRPTGLTFPPWKEAMPAFDGKQVHRFSLDANLLLKLAHAIGVGEPRKDRMAKINLTVVAAEGEMHTAIGVGIDHNDDAVGALMPCRL